MAIGHCNIPDSCFWAITVSSTDSYLIISDLLHNSALLTHELAPLVNVDAERSTAIATWAYQQALHEGSRLWCGINRFVDSSSAPGALLLGST